MGGQKGLILGKLGGEKKFGGDGGNEYVDYPVNTREKWKSD